MIQRRWEGQIPSAVATEFPVLSGSASRFVPSGYNLSSQVTALRQEEIAYYALPNAIFAP